MPVTKTWIVTSARSRHPEMDGETVLIFEPFSNGLDYPGDPAGSVGDTANCMCTMQVNGHAEGPLPFQSIADYKLARESWISGLTETQKAYINSVDSTHFSGITGTLRRQGTLTGNQQEFVRNVDDAISFFGETLPEDTIFYRGGGIGTSESWITGDQFVDKSFLFVSGNPGVAAEFSQGAPIYEIIAPKGTKYIYGNYSQYTEKILPRNLKYEVVGRRKGVVNVWVNGQPVDKEVQVIVMRVVS